MELISVIIPTYNRAEKLVQSVVSVLNQDYDNFEVIVVDDAGDDDTEERIRKLEDNRVRYIRLDENGGPSKARNAGVSAANGNIIAFHDSDDTCHRNRLSIQYKYLKEHPEISEEEAINNEEIFAELGRILKEKDDWIRFGSIIELHSPIIL